MRLIPIIDAALLLSRRISTVMMRIGGIAMLSSAFLITAEVFTRRLLGMSSWGTDEYSYYILAVSVSWTLSYALLEKAHIRIDAIVTLLPSGYRIAFDVLALFSMMFVSITATQAIWSVFLRSWSRSTTSLTTLGTPMWVPQGLFLLGVVVFAVVTVLLMVRVLLALFCENKPEVALHLVGTASADEKTDVVIPHASVISKGPNDQQRGRL